MQSDAAELELQGGYESGTAELQDDQIPLPIPHQSKTLGTEKLLSYPSNSGQPFGQAGGELRYPAPLGTGGTTLLNVGLCPGLKKLVKVSDLISNKTPTPPQTAKTTNIAPEVENRMRLTDKLKTMGCVNHHHHHQYPMNETPYQTNTKDGEKAPE